MKPLASLAHTVAIFALLLTSLGLGVPVAQAAGGHPPKPTPMPDSTNSLAPNLPALPAAGNIHPAPPPGCTATTVTNSNTARQDIPDFNGTVRPITSTITISGAGNYLWDVNVATTIAHTFPSDLKIHLISPAGTVIVLSDRLGGGNPGNVFSGTTWSDQAALFNGSGLPVTDYAFTPGVVAPLLNPEEALGALQGQNPNGTWKLVISDHHSADIGSLMQWSISVVALSQAPSYVRHSKDDFTNVTAIPDQGTAARILDFFDLNTPVTGITLTAVISHALPGSLNIYLVSPAGITITLSTGNGGSNGNVFAGTTWDDKADVNQPANPPRLAAEYQGYAPNVVASPLAPEEALSELNGLNPGVTWKLVVQDTQADLHAGQIGRVGLYLTTATCLPQLQATLFWDAVYPRLNIPTTLHMDAFNPGADASHVVMTGTLPATLTFLGANTHGWTCTTPPLNAHGGTLVCSIDGLFSNAGQTVDVTVLAPPVPMHVPVTVTLSSDQPDTYPPDNTDNFGLDFWAHSADLNPWDIDKDYGLVLSGGNAFIAWGGLRVAVLDPNNHNHLLGDFRLASFNLAYDYGHRWNTTTPVNTFTGLGASRSLLAPAGADWLRYIDTFTNNIPFSLTVIVDWGGGLWSGSNTTTLATSSGDQTLAANDTWAVVAGQNTPGGPAVTAPAGFAFRSPADIYYQGPADFYAHPITTTWPSTGDYALAHQFKFNLAPGATVKLAYFVYRGLAEGVAGPVDCNIYGGCITPVTGSQVTLAENTVAALAANPYFCDVSPAERSLIINWPGIAEHCEYLPLVQR